MLHLADCDTGHGALLPAAELASLQVPVQPRSHWLMYMVLLQSKHGQPTMLHLCRRHCRAGRTLQLCSVHSAPVWRRLYLLKPAASLLAESLHPGGHQHKMLPPALLRWTCAAARFSGLPIFCTRVGKRVLGSCCK